MKNSRGERTLFVGHILVTEKGNHGVNRLHLTMRVPLRCFLVFILLEK